MGEGLAGLCSNLSGSVFGICVSTFSRRLPVLSTPNMRAWVASAWEMPAQINRVPECPAVRLPSV